MRNAFAIQAGLTTGTTTPDYHSWPDNKAMKASSDRNIKNNICVMATISLPKRVIQDE